MGLLDALRDRFGGGYDDYDDDEYYDDEYDDDYDDEDDEYEDDYDRAPQRRGGSGILGNTSRPEAESVAVYTRSGRPVSGNTVPRPAAEGTSSAGSGSHGSRLREEDEDTYASPRSYRPQTSGLNSSGQLPPYVLRAENYEDVQTVVRRVRTNQPVVLVLGACDPAIAQRIIDFSYGLSFGIGGEVVPVTSTTFCVVPEGINLSDAEIERIAQQVG